MVETLKLIMHGLHVVTVLAASLRDSVVEISYEKTPLARKRIGQFEIETWLRYPVKVTVEWPGEAPVNNWVRVGIKIDARGVPGSHDYFVVLRLRNDGHGTIRVRAPVGVNVLRHGMTGTIYSGFGSRELDIAVLFERTGLQRVSIMLEAYKVLYGGEHWPHYPVPPPPLQLRPRGWDWRIETIRASDYAPPGAAEFRFAAGVPDPYYPRWRTTAWVEVFENIPNLQVEFAGREDNRKWVSGLYFTYDGGKNIGDIWKCVFVVCPHDVTWAYHPPCKLWTVAECGEGGWRSFFEVPGGRLVIFGFARLGYYYWKWFCGQYDLHARFTAPSLEPGETCVAMPVLRVGYSIKTDSIIGFQRVDLPLKIVLRRIS